MSLRDVLDFEILEDETRQSGLRLLHVDTGHTDGEENGLGSAFGSREGSDTELEGTASPRVPAASSKRVRTYKPLEGVARVRNLEAQRRYRERLKERAVATEAALGTTLDELEKERAVQDALNAENSALELLLRYSDGMVEALGSFVNAATNAAGSLASSAVSSLLSIHADIIDYLWTKALRPSDTQLRLLARHIDRLPTSYLSSNFVSRLLDAVEQWHRSPPSGRESIERKLAQIFETRARLMAIVLTEYPEKEAHLMRTNACATMHDVIDQATSLSAPDVLQMVALTDDQTAALNAHWDAYTARYRGAKGMVIAAAGQVQLATEMCDSTSGMARRNADAQLGAAAAEAFLAEERAARANLMAAASRTLNPIQSAWLQLMTMRVLPTPDIVGAINLILPHMTRSPVPTPAELLIILSGKVAMEEGGGGGGPPPVPLEI
jgi:hypothetical protein